MRSHDDHDEFDRLFRRTTKLVVVGWIVTALISLAVLGLIAWAIVRVVVHYT